MMSLKNNLYFASTKQSLYLSRPIFVRLCLKNVISMYRHMFLSHVIDVVSTLFFFFVKLVGMTSTSLSKFNLVYRTCTNVPCSQTTVNICS